MTTARQRSSAPSSTRLREARTYKRFNVLESPQGPLVEMAGRGEVIVLSSNNYLGLADHPEVVEAGIEGAPPLRRRDGVGALHLRDVRAAPRARAGARRRSPATEAALTYVSCWNANEAVIPSLADAETVILSDELNHASIIDAVRLSKPERKVRLPALGHGRAARRRSQSCGRGQRKLIVTDGVFSMEGDLAKLPDILELAREHDAVVIVDDSHGVGVLGDTGRGVAEHFGLLGEVDVITGTLGKALGGAAGGYVASSEEVCDLLAQRSRPQLFSNALPPTVACSARAAIALMRAQPELVDAAPREHAPVPRRASGGRATRRSTARRRSSRSSSARRLARSSCPRELLDRGRLRDRLRLPGRAGGDGADPRADVGGARAEHLERALEAFAAVRGGAIAA